jgi:hypothetical protein
VQEGRPNSDKFMRQEEYEEQMNIRDSTFVWSDVKKAKYLRLFLFIYFFYYF